MRKVSITLVVIAAAAICAVLFHEQHNTVGVVPRATMIDGMTVRALTPHIESIYTVQTPPTRPALTLVRSPRPQIAVSEIIRQAIRDPGDEGSLNPNIVLHREVETEEPDPSWSPNAEEQLRANLSLRSDPSSIEILKIQCNASLCEIQAASTHPENAESDGRSWQTAVFDPLEQPWWAVYGFDQPMTTQWNASDGRTLFVSYFGRKF